MASYMDKKDHRARNIFLGACALAAVLGSLAGILGRHLFAQKSSATAQTQSNAPPTAEADQDVATYNRGADSGGLSFNTHFGILKADPKYRTVSEEALKVLAFERLKFECHSDMTKLAISKATIKPRYKFDGRTPLRNLLDTKVEEYTRGGGYKKYGEFLDVLIVEACFSYLELGGPAYAGSVDTFVQSQGLKPNGTYLIIFQDSNGMMGIQTKVKGQYLLHKDIYLRENIPENGVILVY